MFTKLINKYLVFTIFILFLILVIFPSINAIENKSNILNIPSNKTNIFRIGLNGKISLINILNVNDNENNFDLHISKKLNDLCENDEEIQNLINSNNVLPWVEVESSGNGFHRSLRRVIFSNRTLFWRSNIRYHFYNDSDYTKCRFKGDNEWINITGSQRIRLVGFIGYVSFKPNFFLNRFKVHEISIHGYTLRVDKLKLKNNTN